MSFISLGSNIASLKAQRQLNRISSDTSSIYERLSSGQRINNASDDTAGLAVLTSLQADRRVLIQGIRNFNDGISLLNVADGAIEQLSGIVIRIKELAEQAANGTYGTAQRKALDSEAQALSDEYFRIIRSTKFNGRGLFYSEFGELSLQGGYGQLASITSGLGGAIGTGLFGSATSYTTEGNESFDVALGDINGDGILDMITAGYGGFEGATVRLGTGGGSFGATTTYLMHSGDAYGVEIRDINNDGILDLLTAGTSGAASEVSVRLGTGNGTFGAQTTYTSSGSIAYGLTLGDLNGDGNLDLLTADSGGEVSVRLGLGNGTFGTSVSYDQGAAAVRGVALGDINSDGILDLVSTGSNAMGYTYVSLGTGDGSFGAVTSIALAAGTGYDVELADINGDGKLDLITGGNFGGGKTFVALGNGSGGFSAATSYATDTAQTFDIELADVNGDGFLDLISAGSDATAKILLGTGSGTFGTALSYTTGQSGNGSRGLALGDLNGDGVLDLVTAGDNNSATVRLAQTTSGISPLLEFNLASRADALQALSQLSNTLNNLALQRGTIGAFQSRVSTAISHLEGTAENYAAAASRISDADIAAETAELVRNQILSQAAAAVLAQANQQPSLVLKLLADE